MVGSLLTARLAVAAAGESVSPSALWGDLAAGPYAAGYRTVFLADRSRTWATPDGRPDSRGRPIRVSVWYPAIQGSQPMRIEDYVRRTTPAEFADAERVLEERDATVVAEWAPPEATPSLMQARTNAASDATPASGRFPLVLYAGGVNPYTLSNVVLAEFLADIAADFRRDALMSRKSEQ